MGLTRTLGGRHDAAQLHRLDAGDHEHDSVSRNEDFDNAFWSQRVVEDLSANATLFYIWSWTNTRCGMAGLYEVGRRAMTESKVALGDLDAALAELSDARLAFYVDDVLWVVARVKRLRTKTVQMAKSIAKDVAAIDAAHPARVKWVEHNRETSWLRASLSERGVNLHQASGEPQEIVDGEPNSLSLTRTSPEVPLSGEGQRLRSTTASQGELGVTRELIDEAVAILRKRWEIVDEVAVESCAASYPTVDLLQGCRLAVTWASDPSWEMDSCSATLRSALRKLDSEKPKLDEKAGRKASNTAAISSLLRTASA